MAFNFTILNNDLNRSQELLLVKDCASLDKEFYLGLIKFPTFIILNIGINSIMAIAATLGNGMIIIAILRSQNLRTPSYLLITSLAFTDLLVGLVFQPLQSVSYILLMQNNIQSLCTVTSPYLFSFAFLTMISLLMMTCISVDRYSALTLRHRYPTIVTKKRVFIVIFALWIFAVILASLTMVDSQYKIVFIIYCCVASALLITTCVFYIKSFRALHHYTVQIQAQQPNPSAGSFDVVRYKKTLTTMFVVLVCLLSCYAPLICALIARILFGFQKEVVFFFSLSLTFLCVNSSILNPVIYLIRFADIRNAFYQLFRNLVC